MSSDISLEQIKERLVPILQNLSLQAIGTRKKELEDIYSLLSTLFLDISVVVDCKSESSPRDTQFMGFAKALVTEIINEVPATIYPLEIDISDKLEKLLARRAYDLVKHAVVELQYDDNRYSDDWTQKVSDMTELPKED